MSAIRTQQNEILSLRGLLPTVRPARPAEGFHPTPLGVLWNYARGAMPWYVGEIGGAMAWVRHTHRVLQELDDIYIPKKQRREVYCKRFEIFDDRDFEQVLYGCADPSRAWKGQDQTGTWLTPALRTCFMELHRRGFAHSFEAWEGSRLVGGVLGLQIGHYVCIASMFYRADNAAKAAYVRTLLRLRERGFTTVDVNFVTPFFERWGARWVRQWKFEQTLKSLVGQTELCVVDGKKSPPLPWQLRWGLPLALGLQRIGRRAGDVAQSALHLGANPVELAGRIPGIAQPALWEEETVEPHQGVIAWPAQSKLQSVSLPGKWAA